MSVPKVSVIIPMYNCQQYIKKCLESLIKQSIAEFEIIIVNDGSTGQSEAIVVDFINNSGSDNIRLISKDNGGVSSARNIGIKEAKGEWLTFVDADDWVEQDYLKGMLEPLERNPADFCLGGFQKYYEHTEEMRTSYFPDHCFDSREAIIGKLSYPAPIARLYSRSIIAANDIKFDTRIRVGEERAFNFDYLCYVKNCLTVNEKHYIYRIHSSSVAFLC